MIIGAHTVIYSLDAQADRAFIRDVLGYANVDAGDGNLIFKLPPSEVAVHPSDYEGFHELYFICDNLLKTIADLESKGIMCSGVSDEDWGKLTSIILPSGGSVGLYEPLHPLAIEL